MAGAVEQQIGTEIFDDVLGHRIDPIDDGLDDAVGKARQRHGQGIEKFLLGVPFRGDRLGNFPVRGHQRAPDGVRTGLPSSLMAKPLGVAATAAWVWKRRCCGPRTVRLTASSASSEECPATSSNNSRIRFSAAAQ